MRVKITLAQLKKILEKEKIKYPITFREKDVNPDELIKIIAKNKLIFLG